MGLPVSTTTRRQRLMERAQEAADKGQLKEAKRVSRQALLCVSPLNHKLRAKMFRWRRDLLGHPGNRTTRHTHPEAHERHPKRDLLDAESS